MLLRFEKLREEFYYSDHGCEPLPDEQLEPLSDPTLQEQHRELFERFHKKFAHWNFFEIDVTSDEQKAKILKCLGDMKGPLVIGYHLTTRLNAIQIVQGKGEIVGTRGNKVLMQLDPPWSVLEAALRNSFRTTDTMQTAVICIDLPLMHLRGHKLVFDAAFRLNSIGSIPMRSFSGILFDANRLYYDHRRKEVIHDGKDLKFVFFQLLQHLGTYWSGIFEGECHENDAIPR